MLGSVGATAVLSPWRGNEACPTPFGPCANQMGQNVALGEHRTEELLIGWGSCISGTEGKEGQGI